MYSEIKPSAIADNVFDLIASKWMLITSGTLSDFNTMTASWGGLGHIWNKDVAFIFVRPTRFTYTYLESHKNFSLCFFPEDYRSILNYCGAHSGKDVDKVKQTGLTPFLTPGGCIGFEQSELVIECCKLYFSDINPVHFQLPGIQKHYPLKDYHRLYIGEITNCQLKTV